MIIAYQWKENGIKKIISILSCLSLSIGSQAFVPYGKNSEVATLQSDSVIDLNDLGYNKELTNIDIYDIVFSDNWADNIYKIMENKYKYNNEEESKIFSQLFLDIITDKYQFYIDVEKPWEKPTGGNPFVNNISIAPVNPGWKYSGKIDIIVNVWQYVNINIDREYGSYYKSQYFKDNFKVNMINNPLESVESQFIKNFVYELKNNRILYKNPEIFIDTYKNRELEITANPIKETGVVDFYDFELVTKEINKVQAFKPNQKIVIKNIEVDKYDKIDLTTVQSFFNDNYYRIKVPTLDSNNYYQEQKKYDILNEIETYIRKNITSIPVFNKVTNIFNENRDQFTVELRAINKKSSEWTVEVKLNPIKGNVIFKNLSNLVVDIKIDTVYKNEEISINNYVKYSSSNSASWSATNHINTDVASVSRKFTSIDVVSNYSDLYNNYGKMRIYINGSIRTWGYGSYDVNYGSYYKKNVISDQCGAKYNEINLNNTGSTQNYNFHPSLDYRKGTHVSDGHIHISIGFDNQSKFLTINAYITGSTYRAGAYTSYLVGEFQLDKIVFLTR